MTRFFAQHRRFYHLSKTHHPDHNQSDPTASTRFVKISEAYAVLGNPQKRQQYDRELERCSPSTSAFSWGGRTSGGSSFRSASVNTGPAGGRPASGLSRRRTQFKGPPPSFYRSGGWGTHARKRQAAADATASAATASAFASSQDTSRESGTSSSSSSSSYDTTTGSSGSRGGFGDARTSPFLFDDEYNDVPHFDRASHFRTQQQQQESRRRRQRMRRQQPPPGQQYQQQQQRRQTIIDDSEFLDPLDSKSGDIWRNFVFVGGVLLVSLAIPSVFYGVFTLPGRPP